MARTDYFDDPNAPTPNSIVPAAVGCVVNDEGRLQTYGLFIGDDFINIANQQGLQGLIRLACRVNLTGGGHLPQLVVAELEYAGTLDRFADEAVVVERGAEVDVENASNTRCLGNF